ncbi:MAG: hypothetical protein JRD89_06055 [Deltaproteobacteria bacterium]|nr:hypothetical protein [Deltaproteobacteria bacterium]
MVREKETYLDEEGELTYDPRDAPAPLKKLNVKALRKECEFWRKLWEWMPYNVKYWTGKIGHQVGAVRRDYHRWLGVLLGTEFELKSMEIGVYELVYDHNKRRYYWERKIVKVPVGSLLTYEFIADRKPELTEEEKAKAEKRAIDMSAEEATVYEEGEGES